MVCGTPLGYQDKDLENIVDRSNVEAQCTGTVVGDHCLKDDSNDIIPVYLFQFGWE